MARITDKRKAEMWCELNRWDMPPELEGMIDPKDNTARGREMDKIVKKIGKEACLKEWCRQSGVEYEDDKTA